MRCWTFLNTPSSEVTDRAIRDNMTLSNTIVRVVPLCFYASAAFCAGNIVSTNDDGWAVAQIRALYSDMTAAGFNVSSALCQCHFLPS